MLGLHSKPVHLLSMSELPQRLPLSSQAAKLISRKIREGEFTGQLPGERSLAASLQIGRDTMRAALDILESQKIIGPRQQGKRRKILRVSQEKPKIAHRIAFISPKNLRQLSPLMLLELDQLRVLLHSSGLELDIISPAIFTVKNPASRLEKMLAESSHQFWILYQCPASIQLWFQQKNLPCLVRGYPHENVNLSYLDEDWEAAAYHAGLTLARNGHHDVAILKPDTLLAGLEAAEAGLRRAMSQTNPDGIVHTIIDQQEKNSMIRALEHCLKLENPPTAILATRPRHVLTLISWLATHRLRIPHDLSLIALCYEDWFDFILPEIAHYHIDPGLLARDLARKIRSLTNGSQKSAHRKLIIPEYHPGLSIHNISPKK